MQSGLFPGIGILRRRNGLNVRLHGGSSDCGVPCDAARAGYNLDVRKCEIRTVDQLHSGSCSGVRAPGVRVVAIARLLARAVASAEARITPPSLATRRICIRVLLFPFVSELLR